MPAAHLAVLLLATCARALFNQRVLEASQNGTHIAAEHIQGEGWPTGSNRPEIDLILDEGPELGFIGNQLTNFSESYYRPPAAYLDAIRHNDENGIQHDLWRVQHNASADTKTYKLFAYPVGKNLAIVATTTALFLPSKAHLVSGIAPNVKDPYYPPHPKPWLWSRVDRCQLDAVAKEEDNLEQSWGCYFNLPDARQEPPMGNPTVTEGKTTFERLMTSGNPWEAEFDVRPNIADDVVTDKERYLKLLYISSQAYHYAFNMNEETNAMVREIQTLVKAWPKEGETTKDGKKPVIASIHLRRGDVAHFNCTNVFQGRLCSTMHDQIAKLKEFDRYGVTHVYLSCENVREVEYARELAPEYTWMSLGEHIKAHFKVPGGRNMETYLHEETSNPSYTGSVDGVKLEDSVYNMLADMDYAARSDILILEPWSSFSTGIFLKSYGMKGYVPPHTRFVLGSGYAFVADERPIDVPGLVTDKTPPLDFLQWGRYRI